MNPAPGSTGTRNTSVFTNIPIKSSNAASPRPATGVPTAISPVPDNRASNTANAACITMNNDAFCRRPNSTNRRCTSADTTNGYVPPRYDATGGRGRSHGNTNSSGNPARRSTQYPI
ncbi:hypothetical protein NRB56_76640 [Nocardia sp. RB56]|uniref:Uncharacterized protein n=1 Tax=Nocardia aurantia TaxID=2585199 RepID=A0A7K0E2V9_9NOCA|nr:hypothetical protein [Nocardia aurantia]